jgi:undecaprenyl pyrophosphate synthase
MSILAPYIVGIDDHIARAALYYLGRYVKQAEYFEEYGKDIFEDEERSAPNEEVKNLARSMIIALEDREGALASKFSDGVAIRILDEITALEEDLGPEMSDEEAVKAEGFLNALQAPPAKG